MYIIILGRCPWKQKITEEDTTTPVILLICIKSTLALSVYNEKGFLCSQIYTQLYLLSGKLFLTIFFFIMLLDLHYWISFPRFTCILLLWDGVIQEEHVGPGKSLVGWIISYACYNFFVPEGHDVLVCIGFTLACEFHRTKKGGYVIGSLFGIISSPSLWNVLFWLLCKCALGTWNTLCWTLFLYISLLVCTFIYISCFRVTEIVCFFTDNLAPYLYISVYASMSTHILYNNLLYCLILIM